MAGVKCCFLCAYVYAASIGLRFIFVSNTFYYSPKRNLQTTENKAKEYCVIYSLLPEPSKQNLSFHVDRYGEARGMWLMLVTVEHVPW